MEHTAQGSSDLFFLSAAEQGCLIGRRALSPVELVQAYLTRIERYDPVLRAYITVCGDEALAAARNAEREIVAGNRRGPLHGVVFGVKDQLRTCGVRTTVGSKIMADYIPDSDATVITRLKGAGAILIGKENLHEFGKGGTRVFTYGQPRNPWDPKRDPAGSSSGSGIAVAAGFSSASLGEDTGGSVRGPAAACGVVGMRPTFGRVSRSGSVMYGWTADTIGPLTRTVEDTALFLHAIAGHDILDPLSNRRPVPNYTAALRPGLKGIRLAVVKEMSQREGAHAEVLRAFEKALAVLRELGAEITEVSLPWTRHAVSLNGLSSDVDVASMYLPLLKTRWNDFDVGTRTRFAAALLVPASIYSRAMRGRAVVRRQILEALRDNDALLCPTGLTPPGIIENNHEHTIARPDSAQDLGLRAGTHPFAIANTPALALPMGFTQDGLPLSLQIAGRPFAEATVLRIGYAYEQATTWHTRHPDLDRTLSGFGGPAKIASEQTK